ncbi:PREDICTED: uncharacterized protein LOC108577619 [Habropoda laboriosa]|uniref:uncharacterized protein LOC108577619 n=1 Tax=Habropoda laboriosa TaxID=597456 RepID=UPI00083DED89|nr:PREDICTED: uncharacterized protein LOC108577619 [Habropoda laboriosa]
MERYQLIFFIFILYYTGIFKCSVSCAKSDELQTLISTKSNHPDVHNDYQDSNYKIHFRKELKEDNFNINFKGLTEQYRTSRGVAGSRRHLRVGDAHQVANYFLTGGPLKGHAHFRRETNCDSNNDENNVVGMNNPVSEDNTYPSENEQNSMTNLSDSIVGASHIPALYSPFGAAPLVQAPNLYTPLINSVLHPALNTLNTMPHLPLGNDLISSVLHPNLHPHIQALHDIPRALLKTATLPIHSLINARSELRNMLRPQGSLLGNTNRALQRTKLKKNSKNKLMPTNEQYSPISGSPLTNYNNNVRSILL